MTHLIPGHRFDTFRFGEHEATFVDLAPETVEKIALHLAAGQEPAAIFVSDANHKDSSVSMHIPVVACEDMPRGYFGIVHGGPRWEAMK